MSLAFGSDDEPDLVGALSVPRSLTSRKGNGAAAFLARPVTSSRDFLVRATVSSRNRQSAVFNSCSRGLAAKEIGNEFARIADVAGLTTCERAALFGDGRELSQIVLALETLGAALDLFHEADSAVAWLRSENFAEPFDSRAPLQLMVADGRHGVEITLLYLRARLRVAPHL